jgi:peptidoglycan/xylan/chitin deacetylase (PgdA/CDA1 family)
VERAERSPAASASALTATQRIPAQTAQKIAAPVTHAAPVHAPAHKHRSPAGALVRLRPVVPSALWVGSRDGVARVVRARKSHRVISEHVIRRPHVGHLVRPGAVALTFDDGPDRHWTRAVLDLLHRRHVHATFCMIGRQMSDLAGVVRRVVREGNAVCDHTWDHDLDLRARPRGQQVLDVRQGYRAIVRWAKVRPVYFRAPGGEWSRSLERVARAQGMHPLTWTVDPRDWARPGVHAIVRAVLAQLRPGGVILLHDGGGNRSQTLAALKILLHRLPRLGYHFVLPPD